MNTPEVREHSFEDCPGPSCSYYMNRSVRHKMTVGHLPSSDDHLWPCGCLKNDARAHRVGCPDHPEGVRGS